MKLRSKKGFSLVELIIVIAILGIIAVVAVPNLTTVFTKSSVNTDYKTAQKIGESVRTWLLDGSADTRYARGELIANTWVELGKIGGTGNNADNLNLESFISVNQTVSGLNNGAYYVYYNKAKNKVGVGVFDKGSTNLDNSNGSYKYNDETGVVVGGVAYIEGHGPIDPAGTGDLVVE